MKKYKVLVVGVGNMGSAHAKAYNNISEFELVGLVWSLFEETLLAFGYS